MAIFQFFICTQFWHGPYLCRLHACTPTAPHGTGVPGTGVPGTGVLGNLDSGAGAGAGIRRTVIMRGSVWQTNTSLVPGQKTAEFGSLFFIPEP